MEERLLEVPIRVEFRRGDRRQLLRSVRELAELLMDPSWPFQGPAYFRALKLLMDYLEGRKTVSLEQLCAAFSAAMDEADRHTKEQADFKCDPMH